MTRQTFTLRLVEAIECCDTTIHGVLTKPCIDLVTTTPLEK